MAYGIKGKDRLNGMKGVQEWQKPKLSSGLVIPNRKPAGVSDKAWAIIKKRAK